MMQRIIRRGTMLLILILGFHFSSRLLLWPTWNGVPSDARYNALGLGGTLAALSFLLSAAVGSVLRRFADATRIEDAIAVYPQTFEETCDSLTGQSAALNVQLNPSSLRKRPLENIERSFLWVDSIVSVETLEDMGK